MPIPRKAVTLSPAQIQQLRSDGADAVENVRCLALALAYSIERVEREPHRAQELKLQNEKARERIDDELMGFMKKLEVGLGLRPRDESARPE